MSIIIPILAVILLLAVIIVVLSGVKIVQPYEQAVYMRLGKYVRILNQGRFLMVHLCRALLMRIAM